MRLGLGMRLSGAVPARSGGGVDPTEPVFTANPSITGDPYLDSELTGLPGTITGSGLTIEYQWMIEDSEISGATGNTFLITEDYPHGTMLRLRVTATNSGGSAEEFSDAVYVVWPPAYVSGGAISGTTALDAILTASDPTWARADFTYRNWLKNGAHTGESDVTYSIPREDGDSMTCVFYAANNAGEDSHESNAIVAAAPILDSDAENYIQRVETADGEALETGVKQAINQLFLDLKSVSAPVSGTNWNSVASGTLLLMVGPRTLAGILEPLYPDETLPTNTNFVSGDYNRKTGLLGGTGKRIDFRDMSSGGPTINDHAQAVWITSLGTAVTNRAFITSGPTAGTTGMVKSATAASFLFRSANSGSSNNTTVSESTVGFCGLSRSNSANFLTRIAGTTANPTVASSSFHPEQCRLFQRTDGTQQFTGRMAFACFTTAIDLEAMETHLTAYINAVNAALP